MYENKKVLKSKLRFSVASETIIRERLMAVLSNISVKRLSMVIAGAGYGKTTLVNQAISYFQLPVLWYRLDKYDSDFETFFSYLKTGIEEHLGKIEISIEGEVRNGDPIEQVLHLFLSEVENRIEEDLIIVLDDYYLVHDSEEVNRSVEFLIKNMHHQIHLVLISRSEPPVKISKLRVKREVLDLTESDLAFTVSEIEKLYSDVFHLSLQRRTFAGLQEKTGGWAAALILFFHSLKGKSQETADNDLLKISGSQRIISTYLEENIYEMLPFETRDFLVKTALLSKVKAAFCNQLLGISNSKEILSDLEKKHLFTFQLDDEKDCYTYHHIFQDFLKTKINNNYNQQEIQALHEKIARLLEQDGYEEEALEHYLESEQMEDSFRIIRKFANMLWLKGQLKRIKSYLNRIPSKYFHKEPWIKFLTAQLLDLDGQTQEAVQCLEESCDGFFKDNVPHGAALCLQRLGYQYFMVGDFLKAEQTIEKVFNILTDNTGPPSLIYFFSIEVCAQQGKFEQADQYYHQAQALLKNTLDLEYRAALEGGLHAHLAHRYQLSGDFQVAMDLLEKSKQLIEKTGYYALHTKFYNHLAWINYLSGAFSDGLKNAEKGLKLMSDKGFDDFFPSAFLHLSAGHNCLGLKSISEAMLHIKTSMRIFKKIGSAVGQAFCLLVLYQLHKSSEDDAAAAKSLSQCETVIAEYKIPSVEFELKTYQAERLIKKAEFDKAHRLLESVAKESRLFKYLSNRVDFVWACYFWKQNDKKTALKKLLKGIHACRQNLYYFPIAAIAADEETLIPILAALYADGKEQVYIKKVFRQMGLRARSPLIDLQNKETNEISIAASEILTQMPAPAMRVACFGEFKLWRENAELPAERWTSQKARLLFKYLLAERRRGFIPKDILIEMLWPDQNIEKTINRFRVTLSALRKTIEPELIKGMPSSYILNDADGYKLCLGKDGTSDIDEFTEQMRLANENKKDPEKSIHHYLKAEAAYKGEFLSEDLYVDWASEKRDQFRNLYLHVISRILNYYEKRKDFLKCIEYANKYLSVDAYAENIYQILMKQYFHTGNMAMVTLTYEKCKDYIVDDLCSPLSQKTELLYEELILEQ